VYYKQTKNEDKLTVTTKGLELPVMLNDSFVVFSICYIEIYSVMESF